MDNKNFGEYLKSYQEILWPVIEKKIKEANEYPKYCALEKKYQKEKDFHFEIISDYPYRKGKYLRPSLLLMTTLAMGGKIKEALETAAAMQMSEDWILNHDDFEDDSIERRGKTTLHRIYGSGLAVNAGDALHAIMWKCLGENFSKLDKKRAVKIFNEFFTMIDRTILGQGIELKWTKENRFDLSEEDNLLILESKTGYYTIAGPMRLGAILAGASDKELEIIYKFGVMLGRSFQIVDDLLDLTSDFGGLKKTKGNDIYESKRTIMLINLLNKINGKEKVRLLEILDKGRSKTAVEVDEVINLMDKYGSLDYARKKAREYANKAEMIFEKEMSFLKKEPYREQIKIGIEFIVNRDH